MLLRWSAANRGKNFLKGVVALSCPFDISACIDSMGTLYEKFFVNRYKTQVIDPHIEALKQYENTHGVDWLEVYNSKTLRKFHEAITIKIFNYKSVDEYF
jgi:predicted alpha/beta-fold hydrolase